MLLLDYDIRRYAFAKVVARQVYRVPALERLHVYWLAQKIRRSAAPCLTHADNLLLRQRMQDLPDDDLFYVIYNAFVKEVIGTAFQRRLSYSMHPKMRVHLAGTPSVSNWHRDADVTGRVDQINVWLPFTDTFDSNTLWVESDYGKGDYQPIPVRYGQALVFDGGYLSHGSVANDTQQTRVSIDFRFAPRGDSLPPKAKAILGRRPADLNRGQTMETLEYEY
ncbi:streptomycin biosynthesis enzyme StrG [Massilia sp. NR 4-1]|uniref:streptomycin biosynthesis enzyme StrG n=1 Tax=Massilia sp. NR 4-1 TaxID=1678028 RepID=UPI00067E53F0|nr:streptomycin biosynthesis enzyme StrG [Massilia sp. NR 4-1]AKU21546.1 streptomycin biosynthesis enzyme StrG [Massilia sp. NR 4-1]